MQQIKAREFIAGRIPAIRWLHGWKNAERTGRETIPTDVDPADFLATGLSPRRAGRVVYILPGHADFGPVPGRTGKHRRGKSCLFTNRSADVNKGVLADLIHAGLDDPGRCWQVMPT